MQALFLGPQQIVLLYVKRVPAFSCSLETKMQRQLLVIELYLQQLQKTKKPKIEQPLGYPNVYKHLNL